MSNTKKQTVVHSVWTVLFCVALASLFFSYQPVIYLGSAGGANLEVSLAQIGIGLFILASIGVVAKQWRVIFGNVPMMLLTALAVMSSLSLLWTTNIARGALVSVLLWAIVALWASLHGQAIRLHHEKAVLGKVGWWTVLVVALFGWFQVFADALGVSTVVTLLPSPYVSGVFGFARPTGFALEPQFLGSLLLAPVLYGMYREIRGTATLASRVLWLLSLSVIVATISRGAYIALVIGMVVLIAVSGKERIRSVFRMILLAVGATVVSFGLLASAAQMNARDTTNGLNAVIQSINHLSIGMVDIPLLPEDKAADEPRVVSVKKKTVPDNGYVEESTTSRLSMSREALALWAQSPQTILIGVGAGGFGAALHEKSPRHSLSSIVNNQYVEVLVELGVIGLAVFLTLISSIVYWYIKRRQWLAVSVLATYLVQWCFFSGNINVLHIWVLIGVVLFVLSGKSKKPADA